MVVCLRSPSLLRFTNRNGERGPRPFWLPPPFKQNGLDKCGNGQLPFSPPPLGFPGGSTGKESACDAGDLGSIPGLGRSSGEGNGYPLQYSGLENSMDRGAWQATVHGIANSWTQLSDPHFFINTVYVNINIVYKYTIFQTLIMQRNCQG